MILFRDMCSDVRFNRSWRIQNLPVLFSSDCREECSQFLGHDAPHSISSGIPLYLLADGRRSGQHPRQGHLSSDTNRTKARWIHVPF